MTEIDFARYYDLERYLFKEVSERFRSENTLSAFDFFCIVIWKANRAKSKVAKRLVAKGHPTLESAVHNLLNDVTNAVSPKARLAVLVEQWGFRLPMASAILTVLYPDEFTVYDVRVCETLGDFKDAQNRTKFDVLWDRYSGYVDRVRSSASTKSSLRDKDRFLWGQSFETQLRHDIERRFQSDADD